MNHFYAYINRLKLIRRWGLMHNTVPENDMEHSMQAALIAHGLAVLGKTRYQRDIDPQRVLAMALYHDAGEVITGDLPTPVKYQNPSIQDAYQDLETLANQQLLAMLPKDMREQYRAYLVPDEKSYEYRLVKAADRICAYLKCVEEQKMGNREFDQARITITDSINQNPLPEVHAFMREFVPSFSLSLDDLSRLPSNREEE
ncbi:MAG: 5'-deoxynucleotidase [Clostridiales bacterium]|nr:5'-deoxynucleotidase [Clostridiales bacterium]